MAVGDTHVFPGFFTTVLTQLSYHASEVRDKNMLERRFASNKYQTQNHQVMSLTCSHNRTNR